MSEIVLRVRFRPPPKMWDTKPGLRSIRFANSAFVTPACSSASVKQLVTFSMISSCRTSLSKVLSCLSELSIVGMCIAPILSICRLSLRVLVEDSHRLFKVATSMTVGLFANTVSNDELSRTHLLGKGTDEPNLKALELPQRPTTHVSEFLKSLLRWNPSDFGERVEQRLNLGLVFLIQFGIERLGRCLASRVHCPHHATPRTGSCWL